MRTAAQKKIPHTPELTIENDLPEGWTAVSLSSVSARITDGTHKTPDYVDNGIRFVSTANLVPFKPGFDFSQYERFISQVEHRELTKHCFPEEGDVLISKCGTIGRTKEVDVAYPFSIFVGLALLKPLPGLFAKGFLECFLNSPEIQRQFEHFAPGSTRRTLTLAGINRVELCIPPLPEQKRIVAKIEELLAQVNAARARLAKVTQILKRFRQSVLAAACSGRLTVGWHDANSQVESTGSLDDSDVDSLPESWKITTVGEVASVRGGKRLPKGAKYSETSTQFPYIRVTDFSEMSVRLDDLKYIDEETRAQILRYTISDSDVYISIAGSIGKVGIVPPNLDGANLTENAAKLTGLTSVTKEYLTYALNADSAQQQIKEFITSSGQPKLALFRIESISLPLPPVPEQHEIVRRVKTLLARADAIERQVEAAMKRADKLTFAILSKAFRAELVPTEAELARCEGRDYEPASTLLERVHAPRERKARRPNPGNAGGRVGTGAKSNL